MDLSGLGIIQGKDVTRALNVWCSSSGKLQTPYETDRSRGAMCLSFQKVEAGSPVRGVT